MPQRTIELQRYQQVQHARPRAARDVQFVHASRRPILDHHASGPAGRQEAARRSRGRLAALDAASISTQVARSLRPGPSRCFCLRLVSGHGEDCAAVRRRGSGRAPKCCSRSAAACRPGAETCSRFCPVARRSNRHRQAYVAVACPLPLTSAGSRDRDGGECRSGASQLLPIVLRVLCCSALTWLRPPLLRFVMPSTLVTRCPTQCGRDRAK